MPRGAIAQFDWIALYCEFKRDHKSNDLLTIKQFAETKKLNYTNTSRQFAEIARIEVGEIGSMLAPEAIKKIGSIINNKDANLALKASTAILDRTGFSPKEQSIQVTNNIQMNVALFNSEEKPKIESMFGDAVIEEAKE